MMSTEPEITRAWDEVRRGIRLLLEAGELSTKNCERIVFELLSSPRLLRHARLEMERNISRNYLPGFHFASDSHARWHIGKRDYVLHRIGVQGPASRFSTHWVRAILVPRPSHYRAELAFGLKQTQQNLERMAAALNKKYDGWKWYERVEQVLEQSYFHGGKSPLQVVDRRTVFRWSWKAREYRATRLKNDPPSAWYIGSINYDGMPLRLTDKIDEWVTSPYTGYSESWKWNPEHGLPAPHMKTVTFTAPASADLWAKTWPR